MPVFPLLVEMFVTAKQEEEEAEDAYGAWDGRSVHVLKHIKTWCKRGACPIYLVWY